MLFVRDLVQSSRRSRSIEPVLGRIRHRDLLIALASGRRFTTGSLDAVDALQVRRYLSTVIYEVQPVDCAVVGVRYARHRQCWSRHARGLLCLESWGAVGRELEVGLRFWVEEVMANEIETERVLDADGC